MANINNPAQLNNEIAFSQQVINIGKKPGNDIILRGDSIADFHAMLSYSKNTWMLIPLDPAYPVLLENTPVSAAGSVVTNGANITIGDYRLKLTLNGINTDFIVTETVSASSVNAAESSADRYILLKLDGTVPTQVDPGSTVEYGLQVINAGPLVANMQLQVQGVPSSWVQVVPAVLNLNEGKRGDMIVRITPPRSSEAKAGNYPIHFVCLSPNYPGEVGTADANLQITPFYEYIVSGPNPRRQQIKRNAPVEETTVTISNRSNADMNFLVHAYDDMNELNFGVNGSAMTAQNQTQVSVPAGQKADIPLTVTSRKLPLFGWMGHSRNYYVNTTPQENPVDQQSLVGEAYVSPMISALWLIIMAFALLLALGILLQPSIHYFRDSNNDRVEVIFSGNGTDLSWSASIFATECTLITEDTDCDPVSETVARSGHKYCQPDASTTYTLVAENFLSRLLGLEYTKEVRVIVVPERPEIPLFKSNVADASFNDTAKVSWSVADDADYATLDVNRQETKLKEEEYSSDKDVVLEGDTLLSLKAGNESGFEEKSFFINVKPNKIDLVKFTAWVRPSGIAIPNDNDTRRSTRWASITALNSLTSSASSSSSASAVTLKGANTQNKPFAQTNLIEIPDDYQTGSGMTQNVNPEQQLLSSQTGTALYQSVSADSVNTQDLLVRPGMATPTPAPTSVPSAYSPAAVTGTAVPSTSPESQTPNSEFTVKLVEVIEDPTAESGYRVIDYFPDYVLQPKEQILIEWQVEDASSVAIEQLADRGRKANGAEYDFPEVSTNYVLTATLGSGNKIFSLPVRVAGDSDDGEGSGLNCALSSNSTKLETPGSVMLNWTGAGNNRVQIVSSAKAENDYNKAEAEKAKDASDAGKSYTSPENGEMTGGIIGDYLQPSGFMRVNVSKQTSFVLNAYDANNNIICSKTVKVEVTDGDDKNELTFKITSAEDADDNERTVVIDDVDEFGKYLVGEKVYVKTELTKTIDGKDPTGTITISDGYTSCTATLPITGCQLTTTHAGSLRLTAIYSGDSNYKKATSKGWLYVVSDKLATETTITSAKNDPSIGLTFTTKLGWTADDSLYSGEPTGTIDFKLTMDDGTTETCTYTIASKTSTCGNAAVTVDPEQGVTISGWKTESKTAAPKTISASYSGDTYFAASESGETEIDALKWNLTLTFTEPQYRDYYDINKTSGKYYPARIDLVPDDTTPYDACNPYNPDDAKQDTYDCTEIKNKKFDISISAASDAPLSSIEGQTLTISDSSGAKQTCTIEKNDGGSYHCAVDFNFKSTGMKTLTAEFEGSSFFNPTETEMDYVNVIRLDTGKEKGTKTTITAPVSPDIVFVTDEAVPVSVKVVKSVNDTVEVENGNVMIYAYEESNPTQVLSSCEIDGYKKAGNNSCILSFTEKSVGSKSMVIIAEYTGSEDYKPSAAKTAVTIYDDGTHKTTLTIAEASPSADVYREYDLTLNLDYEKTSETPTGSMILKKGSGGSGNQCTFNVKTSEWYEDECKGAKIEEQDTDTGKQYKITNLPFSSMKVEDVTAVYSGDKNFMSSTASANLAPTKYDLALLVTEPSRNSYFDISGANSRYYPQEPSQYTDPFGHCNPYTEGSEEQKDCVKLTDSAEVSVEITLPQTGDRLPSGTVINVTDGTNTCKAELQKNLEPGDTDTVSCKLKFSKIGQTTLTASFAGDDCYNAADDPVTPYYVVNLPDSQDMIKTKTAIITPATGSVYSYNNVVTFKVKVTDADDNPVKGAVIIYDEDRKIVGSGYYDGDPESSGNNINILMSEPGYRVKFYAEFLGTDKYASSVSDPIVLDILEPVRIGTKIAITAPANGDEVTVNQPLKVNVSLDEAITSNSILPYTDGTITVTDNYGGSCEIQLPTEVGAASAECELTPTISGTIYILQASYSGDASFKPAVSSNVKVKTVAAADKCTAKITNIKIYKKDGTLYPTNSKLVYKNANRTEKETLYEMVNTVIALDIDRVSYFTYDLETQCDSGAEYTPDGVVTIELLQKEYFAPNAIWTRGNVIYTGIPGQVDDHDKLKGAGQYSAAILISQEAKFLNLKTETDHTEAYYTGQLQLAYSGDSHYEDVPFVDYGQDTTPKVYLEYGGAGKADNYQWKILDIRDKPHKDQGQSYKNKEIESGKKYYLVVEPRLSSMSYGEYTLVARQSTMCYDRTSSENPCVAQCSEDYSYCTVPVGFIEPGIYRPELSVLKDAWTLHDTVADFNVTVKPVTVTPSLKLENIYYSGADCSTRTYEEYSEENLPNAGNGLRGTLSFPLDVSTNAFKEGEVLGTIQVYLRKSNYNYWSNSAAGNLVYKDGKIQDVVFDIPILPKSGKYTLSVSFHSVSTSLEELKLISKEISVNAGLLFLYPAEASGVDIASDSPVYRWTLKGPDSPSYAEHIFYPYLARGKADDNTSGYSCKMPLGPGKTIGWWNEYNEPEVDNINLTDEAGATTTLSDCNLTTDGSVRQYYYRCVSSNGGASITKNGKLTYDPSDLSAYERPDGYHIDIDVAGGSAMKGLAISNVTGDGEQLNGTLSSTVTLTYTKSSASEADPTGKIAITGTNTRGKTVTKEIEISETTCKKTSSMVLTCADIQMPAYTYGGGYTYSAIYYDGDGTGKQEATYDQYVYINPMPLTSQDGAQLIIADYTADNCEVSYGSNTLTSSNYVWQTDTTHSYYAGSALKMVFTLTASNAFTADEAAALPSRLTPYLVIQMFDENEIWASGTISVTAGTTNAAVEFTLTDYEFPTAGDYKMWLYVEDSEDQYMCSDYLNNKAYEFKDVMAPALVLTGANGTDFTTEDGLTYKWNADFTALSGSTVNFTVKVMQGNQPRCLADFTDVNYPASPKKIQVVTLPQNLCDWVDTDGVRQLRCTENWNTDTISYWQTEADRYYTLYNNVTTGNHSHITINPEQTGSTSGNSVTMSVTLEP